MHLLAVLLANDRDRRLARAKALEARGTRNLAQPLSHFAINFGGGNCHLKSTFQSARGG
jgi:hypothetical protein